jgi:hypothetical protein
MLKTWFAFPLCRPDCRSKCREEAITITGLILNRILLLCQAELLILNLPRQFGSFCALQTTAKGQYSEGCVADPHNWHLPWAEAP